MVAARSAASAIFRFVDRVAAPRSPNVFQASSMMRTRWRESRTQTSIEWDGSAGRVGSSKVAVRPVRRASASRCSCIARWPASAGCRIMPSGRVNDTARGWSSATPIRTHVSNGTLRPPPSSMRLIQVWWRSTLAPRSSCVSRARMRPAFTAPPSAIAMACVRRVASRTATVCLDLVVGRSVIPPSLAEGTSPIVTGRSTAGSRSHERGSRAGTAVMARQGPDIRLGGMSEAPVATVPSAGRDNGMRAAEWDCGKRMVGEHGVPRPLLRCPR